MKTLPLGGGEASAITVLPVPPPIRMEIAREFLNVSFLPSSFCPSRSARRVVFFFTRNAVYTSVGESDDIVIRAHFRASLKTPRESSTGGFSDHLLVPRSTRGSVRQKTGSDEQTTRHTTRRLIFERLCLRENHFVSVIHYVHVIR